MPSHGYIQAAAAAFWTRAAIATPFPRQMDLAIMLTLPVSIIPLPRLQLASIEIWLRRYQIPYRFPCANRRVRGCLVAYKGCGLIFVDETDSPDERRLTLAHEAAHFLEHYLKPREEAIKRLGPEIVPVLDGEREPTVTERVHAILASTPLQVYYKYIDRGPKGELALSAVWDVEDQADQLALELIAPLDQVRIQVVTKQPLYQQRVAAVTALLTTDFGLPPDMASLHSKTLLHSIGQGPTFLEHLGLKS